MSASGIARLGLAASCLLLVGACSSASPSAGAGRANPADAATTMASTPAIDTAGLCAADTEPGNTLAATYTSDVAGVAIYFGRTEHSPEPITDTAPPLKGLAPTEPIAVCWIGVVAPDIPGFRVDLIRSDGTRYSPTSFPTGPPGTPHVSPYGP